MTSGAAKPPTENNDNEAEKLGPIRRITHSMGRSLTAISIPYIMLGYPVAGYLIGLFIKHLFHTADWVPILVMMLALVEAFREVFRIATQVSVDDDKKEDDKR